MSLVFGEVLLGNKATRQKDIFAEFSKTSGGDSMPVRPRPSAPNIDECRLSVMKACFYFDFHNSG
jgi:hypothetical protein